MMKTFLGDNNTSKVEKEFICKLQSLSTGREVNSFIMHTLETNALQVYILRNRIIILYDFLDAFQIKMCLGTVWKQVLK